MPDPPQGSPPRRHARPLDRFRSRSQSRDSIERGSLPAQKNSVHETVSKDQADQSEEHRRALRTAFHPGHKLKYGHQPLVREGMRIVRRRQSRSPDSLGSWDRLNNSIPGEEDKPPEEGPIRNTFDDIIGNPFTEQGNFMPITPYNPNAYPPGRYAPHELARYTPYRPREQYGQSSQRPPRGYRTTNPVADIPALSVIERPSKYAIKSPAQADLDFSVCSASDLIDATP
jgi:hypothetical protein